MLSEQNLREGKLEEALASLQDDVRKSPSDPKLRIFLFQLLAVLGRWDRALTQLQVIGELDADALAMVQTYREALRCEALRTQIFAGKRSPLIFGQPEQWLALLVEALRLTAEEQYGQAADVRGRAFEAAPATSGHIGGEGGDAFEWIADADSRLGPVLEVIVNGNYYWVPFHRIRSIHLEEPADLRDVVWTPAFFTWTNGGEAAGLIPTRYPGSEASERNEIRFARRTEFDERPHDTYLGLGQRMLATDAGEYSLMDLRLISLDSPMEDSAGGSD